MIFSFLCLPQLTQKRMKTLKLNIIYDFAAAANAHREYF